MNGTLEILPGIKEILDKFLNENQMAEFLKTVYTESDLGDLTMGANSNFSSSLEFRERIRRQIDEVITFSEGKLNFEKQLMILNNLGKLTIERGEFSLAKNIYLKILKETNKRKSLDNISAYSLLALGDIYNREARWKRSLEHIDKAKKLFEGQKDTKGLAQCQNLIGAIHLGQGKIGLSSKHFEEGISHLSQKRDKSVLAMMEGNLGTVKSIQGNFDLAFTYYRRALLKFEETGNLKRIAEIRHNLGMLHTQKRQYELALAEFDTCIRISLNANYLPTQGIAFLGKAYIYAQKNYLKLAKTLADRAMKISHQLDDSLSTAEIYKVYGIIERKIKNYPVAENHFLTSIRINTELENELNLSETWVEIGILYKDMGKNKDANLFFKKAMTYYKKIKTESEVARIQSLLIDNGQGLKERLN